MTVRPSPSGWETEPGGMGPGDPGITFVVTAVVTAPDGDPETTATERRGYMGILGRHGGVSRITWEDRKKASHRLREHRVTSGFNQAASGAGKGVGPEAPEDEREADDADDGIENGHLVANRAPEQDGG